MFARSPVAAALVATLAFVGRADAHGYLVQPLAKFISQNIDITQYSSTIDSYALFPSGTFNTAPETNVASFVENYENSSYANVKEMIVANQVVVSTSATADCGFSDPSKTSYGALNDTIYWGKSPDLTGEGFVVGHMGPCETWCDDNLAQQDMNCQVTYNPASGSGAAPVPIDTSKCASASRLTFYWIAMHGPTWQVYINCININGNTSSGTGSSSSSTTTTTAPAATTAAPTTTTAAPTTTTSAPATTTAAPAASTASSDEYDDDSTAADYDDESASGAADETEAPTATTTAPVATTAAPATTTAAPASGDKCNARARRNRN